MQLTPDLFDQSQNLIRLFGAPDKGEQNPNRHLVSRAQQGADLRPEILAAP